MISRERIESIREGNNSTLIPRSVSVADLLTALDERDELLANLRHHLINAHECGGGPGLLAKIKTFVRGTKWERASTRCFTDEDREQEKA